MKENSEANINLQFHIPVDSYILYVPSTAVFAYGKLPSTLDQAL